MRPWVRAALALGALGASGLALWVAAPPPAGLLARPPGLSLTLSDRNGLPLRATRSEAGARQRWIGLADLDPDLLVAFVAAEDRRFFRHHGVDLPALARAGWANLRAGRVVSGGSTITMQLARLLHPSARSVAGKLTQIAWAVRFDLHWPKQVILEQYLNRVPLGQGAVGVEAAAGLYFGGTARSLSLGQAALLAGLAGGPSRNNPLTSPSRARSRRAAVLARARRLGLVSPAEVAGALEERVLPPPSPDGFQAPHFTNWVLARLEEGREDTAPAELRTSLDLPLQHALEAEVRHTVEVMRDRGARHAAAVVLDNRSGDLLAWVGSPDFFEPASGQVDMVISPRQPGSALKPFLYGLAFDRGYTPAAILADVATLYRTATGPYAPRNYDRRFHGPVRAREALGSSFNLPAVELADRLGVPLLLETLRGLGFASLHRSAGHYGLGLALGNGDVTLLELANAYRALANGGVWHPVRWTASRPGDPPGEGRVVIGALSAALVLDILADPVARIPGFGTATPLEFPFATAAKTGTSRHFTDNWAVAVTGGFTVAVWVGNFDGRPMEGVSGVSGAGPLLHRAVLSAAARRPPGTLPSPGALGARATTICRVSGLRAGPGCPAASEWLPPGAAPERACDWHTPAGLVLPAEFREWAARSAGGNAVAAAGMVRAASDTAPAGFRITSPRAGDTYRFMPGVETGYATIGLRTTGPPAGARVRWYVDGKPHAGTRWALVPGRHTIRAAAGATRDEVTIAVVAEDR